jgi:flagellar basal-body rod modification protein FlgD
MIVEGLETSAKSILTGWETTDTSPRKELGREEFLTLLLEQLKHQDPLNPLESAEFTAQLAQFSSLEQLTSMNEALTEIQESLENQESGNPLDYIGKVVKTNDNAVSIREGNVDSNAYTLDEAAQVMIFIYDGEGFEVRRINAGWKDAGEHGLNWDGRDNNGDFADDGVYAFEVHAINGDGFLVSSDTYLTGEVTGVTYQGGIPYLMIGNRLVTPENIIEITKNNSQQEVVGSEETLPDDEQETTGD